MDFVDDDGDMFADSPDVLNLGDPLDIPLSPDISVAAGGTTKNAENEPRNPVKEHLLRQLNEVDERIEVTKRQIDETNSLKAKILNKFSRRAFYGQSSSSSESDSELFTVTGEPTIKRRKKSRKIKLQALVVTKTWQHVVDDKWIVGVMLENTSDHDLYELDFYARVKNSEEFVGVSSFWTRDSSKSFWRKTDMAKCGSSCEVAATVVLDLPKFTKNSSVELIGTINYESDDVILQTLIPKVDLHVDKILAGEHELRISACKGSELTENLIEAIISVKSLSIEKITDFKINHPLNKDFKNILVDVGFQEILPKVFIGRNSTLDRCIFEIMSTSASLLKYKSIIYSRSIQQLNMLLHLMHGGLPLGTTISCRNVTATGVIQAFETELNLYLTTGNSIELQEAIVKSDLMSEEFETGCTIYTGK